MTTPDLIAELAELAEVVDELRRGDCNENECLAMANRLNRVRADIEAMARDAKTLYRAREQLPTKVETEHLGDYGPDELAAFDSGYNMALDLAHNLLSRQPGAITSMRDSAREGGES